jgi:hypothetical protein
LKDLGAFICNSYRVRRACPYINLSIDQILIDMSTRPI